MNKLIKQIVESKFSFNINIYGDSHDSLAKSKYKAISQLGIYKISQINEKIIKAFKNRNLFSLPKKCKTYLYQNFENYKQYQYVVKNNKELQDIVNNIHTYDADLNWIDTSNITDMSCLFLTSTIMNLDISMWDVSNVKSMASMFKYCNFTCDLSKWDVSNVFRMDSMFENSKFNSNISMWDVSNVKYYGSIFKNCNIKEEYKPKFKVIL